MSKNTCPTMPCAAEGKTALSVFVKQKSQLFREPGVSSQYFVVGATARVARCGFRQARPLHIEKTPNSSLEDESIACLKLGGYVSIPLFKEEIMSPRSNMITESTILSAPGVKVPRMPKDPQAVP